MKKILVTGANNLIGYGILKDLRKQSSNYHLIGTTVYQDSVALGFCDTFIKAPYTSDVNYIKWLKQIITQNKIDLIIPGFFEDVPMWAEHYNELGKNNVKIVLNNRKLIALCEDKWEFYKILESNNSPYAIPTSLLNNYTEFTNRYGPNLVLKPRRGASSRGIVYIKTEEEFNFYKSKIGIDLMVQPYIGSKDLEYTTSAFGDGKGGYFTSITLKRVLSKQGYTSEAEVCDNEIIEEAVSKLCKIFNPIGPTNFQFRIHKGECKLLEINPRFSSATSIRSGFGYHDAIMAAEFYLEDKMPEQPLIKQGKAYRFIEDYFRYS